MNPERDLFPPPRQNPEARLFAGPPPAPCEVCGAPIAAAGGYWHLEHVRASGGRDEVYLGSARCFVEWTLNTAAHYLEHLEAKP